MPARTCTVCTCGRLPRAQGLQRLAERPVRGLAGCRCAGSAGQGAGSIDHQGGGAHGRQAHGKAARVGGIGGRRGLLLFCVGKAVVVGIRVGLVPQAIPIGVLGLARVRREGIEEIDDAIAIRIGKVRPRALHHLQAGDDVEDIEAVARPW